MTKPIGPICNLDCDYCFYLKKEKLFDHKEKKEFKISDEGLELFTQKYIEAHKDFNEVTFAWQGGEPTIMGLKFFKRAVELQKKYAFKGMKVQNAVQTNATLITDEMAIFFKENNFLVGVSIDGPEAIHNKYRKDKAGFGSFKDVITGLEILKKYSVDFNTLTVVQRDNSQHPKEVYEFLKSIGSTYLQFIPIVEWDNTTENGVSKRSVLPEDFAKFMNQIFDLWAIDDIGKIFINHFDMLLGIYVGYPASLCVNAKTCGTALAMEHNGALYSCDHFVDKKHYLGNIFTDNIKDLVFSPEQIKFGNDKYDTLPPKCLSCRYLPLCYGACPKDRLENGVNFLCQGYYKFYEHTEPYFAAMASALKNRTPVAEFRKFLKFRQKPDVQRNDPCPCLSGKKFKNCCGS